VKSAFAVLHDAVQVKEEAKEKAAVAERKAAAAEREKESAKECRYCYEEKAECYALVPCGHTMCSKCKELYEALPCQTCKKNVDSYLKLF